MPFSPVCRHGPGIGWVTVADPAGNQFSVLRSEEERRATS